MGINVEALEYCIRLRATAWRNSEGVSPGLIPDLLVIRALLATAVPDDVPALLKLRALATGDPEIVALIDALLSAFSDFHSRIAQCIKDNVAWHWEWEGVTTIDNTPKRSKKTMWKLRFVASR